MTRGRRLAAALPPRSDAGMCFCCSAPPACAGCAAPREACGSRRVQPLALCVVTTCGSVLESTDLHKPLYWSQQPRQQLLCKPDQASKAAATHITRPGAELLAVVAQHQAKADVVDADPGGGRWLNKRREHFSDGEPRFTACCMLPLFLASSSKLYEHKHKQSSSHISWSSLAVLGQVSRLLRARKHLRWCGTNGHVLLSPWLRFDRKKIIGAS